MVTNVRPSVGAASTLGSPTALPASTRVSARTAVTELLTVLPMGWQVYQGEMFVVRTLSATTSPAMPLSCVNSNEALPMLPKI